MEKALKKKLMLLTFIPLLLVAGILVGILWLNMAWVPFSAWVLSKGLVIPVLLGVLAFVAAFALFELIALLQVARLVGKGTRALLKVTETGRLSREDVPEALVDDVEYSVLAKRLEQLSRGARGELASSKRLSHLEEELQRVANAIEEVSVGSPFVPLPEREGMAGRIAGLLNKILPEFCELRKSSVKEIQGVETDLREAKEASQELAAHTERSFVESTEALVLAREAGRLTMDVREKLQALSDRRSESAKTAAPREEIKDVLSKVIEAAAGGVEELTKGIMKSNALSRSAERIANRASVLALNVAVEAAKASMPGMNVLSEEIRKLAEFARASSDESAILVTEIEAKVDSIVRTIHISQEEVRQRIRSLGISVPDERAGEEEQMERELSRAAIKLGEASERLLAKVRELSKLTEKASREAQSMSRKALAAHDQTEALVRGESWKSLAGEPEAGDIETLGEESFLGEESPTDREEGE